MKEQETFTLEEFHSKVNRRVQEFAYSLGINEKALNMALLSAGAVGFNSTSGLHYPKANEIVERAKVYREFLTSVITIPD